MGKSISSCRKTCAYDEICTVVDERDAITDGMRQLRERRTDVPRAADDDVRLRLDAFVQHARPVP